MSYFKDILTRNENGPVCKTTPAADYAKKAALESQKRFLRKRLVHFGAPSWSLLENEKLFIKF
jgi:hypothetical protein